MNHKRTSAAQFFQQEDDDDDYISPSRGITTGPGSSSTSRSPRGLGGDHGGGPRGDYQEPNDYKDEAEVAELLTRATITNNEKMKLENLRRVQEIILKRQPALLDNFLDEMLNFHTESNPDVKVFILEFIADSCCLDPESIPKVMPTLESMLTDSKVTVMKMSIHVMAKIYSYTLMWLCRVKNVSDEMETVWNYMIGLKKQILRLIDNDNDAIRTYTVKFMERIILLQTGTDNDSYPRNNEFCLDDVPITVKVARPRKLEEDAKILFEELLGFLCSRHASSVNLMTSIGSVILIAKSRPQFMGKVIASIEKLIAVLPPTLERTQVESVRKHMKNQLIGLLRHPKALDYFEPITTLLTDLGTTNQELHKSIPNWDEIRYERRKRARALAAEKEEVSNRKRARLEIEPVFDDVTKVLEEDYDDEEEDNKPKTEDMETDTDHVDIENKIFVQLNNIENAVDIVITSMENLPDTPPNHFMATFTPIAIAGTEGQIKHLSRLITAQIVASNKESDDADMNEDDEEELKIPTLVSNVGSVISKKSDFPPQVAPQMKRKMIYAKLGELIRPISRDGQEKFMTGALRRVLSSHTKYTDLKCKIIASIGATASNLTREYLMIFICEDLKARIDMGLHWIFSEYNLSQGFMTKSPHLKYSSNTERYEWTFHGLMKAIMASTDADKSIMIRRMYTETPLIPDKGLDLLKELCGQPQQSTKALQLLVESVTRRPMPKKLHYLSALLEFCSHASEDIRTQAVEAVINLYETETNLKVIFEDQAVHTFLNSLKSPQPPESLFTKDLGRPQRVLEWTESLVLASIHLYLEMLTIKNSLIHELAKVYVETDAPVKRAIFKFIEIPIRKMGMNSEELMKLLDTFPKGCETLVTRIIHILTDKTLPSSDLVVRVRNLYLKRVSDVRFLIPVINGLTKSEIISALPKLLKLNAQVVKGVFNRLLETHVDSKSQHKSPISPADLLVALHNIEPAKCDVKLIIKATAICFSEAEVYTAEVLAVVISQLLEQTPLPTLLMRTVIQTLALHSKLSGFILRTLTCLIEKQVWNQPKIWEGFIKCCQRTIPKSIPILLKLPAAQLKHALDEAPDLRGPLAHHIMSFSQQQRSCMPPSLLKLVLRDSDQAGYMGIKEEEPYYEGEVLAPGAGENGNIIRNLSLVRHGSVKEEHEVGENDSSISIIKDEPLEYTSGNSNVDP